MLHIYHFTLQTSKICLSGTQDLHRKLNLYVSGFFQFGFGLLEAVQYRHVMSFSLSTSDQCPYCSKNELLTRQIIFLFHLEKYIYYSYLIKPPQVISLRFTLPFQSSPLSPQIMTHEVRYPIEIQKFKYQASLLYPKLHTIIVSPEANVLQFFPIKH